MLQKILFESNDLKPQENTNHYNKKFSSSKTFDPIIFSKKVLYHKYSKFEYSFSLFCTNNLIYNEKCRIVARFKDFLVLDDSTEFLRRFYSKKELKNRLKKIYNFYENYCKIFPNYMILPESQFLYRNIRKKQKMIDAFNEIKKEEEENRRHLKLGLIDKNKKDKEENIVFTQKIQESIERYHPSVSYALSSTFMSDINNNLNNEFGNNDKSIISISLSSHTPLNLMDLNNYNINEEIYGLDKYFSRNKNSFEKKENNFIDISLNSQNSLFNIVKTLNGETIENNKKNNNTINNDINSNTNSKKNKKDFKSNISQINYNKLNKNKCINNSNNNNIKSNTKKLFSINNINNNNSNNTNNNFNSINNNNKNNNINNNFNSANNNVKKSSKYHSNNKNQKPNLEYSNNINYKRKFISHKQTGSVPISSEVLNSNENNIIEENNTIKIINNINNIIINDGKNNNINNGMVININNNYFQLKDPKKINEKIMKRVKSKEEEMKQNKKNRLIENDKDKEDKDDEYPQFKMFREKRTYTNYNTQNTIKKNKKFFSNDIQSPIKNNISNQIQNIDNKKHRNINSNNFYININNNNINNFNNNNAYKNNNQYSNELKKKNYKKFIENKTINDNFSQTFGCKNNIDLNNYNNNDNILSNKLKISMNKNIKEKSKLDMVNSIDKKNMSLNKKLANNYLTTTQKKKTYQGRFNPYPYEKTTSLNSINNNRRNIYENNNNNNISEKLQLLNICNTTIKPKNNPIKYKLDKKSLIRKNKTNLLQINNNQFLSSFNLQKEKIGSTNIDLDVINLEDNIVKYHKKTIKGLMDNKTQSNSEAEFTVELNNKNNIYKTITNKSLKNDKIKNINDNKNNINNDMNINSNELKTIKAKEMKEKYHKLLRGNKITHGSYDTNNRLHLFKKLKGVNNVISSVTNSINNTTTNNNKRSPLMKKGVLSPSERINSNMSNYIKTQIKNKFNMTQKESSIENNNTITGNKFHLMGKKNKIVDTNNKRMKFIKK